MRGIWAIPFIALAFAGCSAPETVNEIEQRLQDPRSCEPDGTTFQAFHDAWEDNVTAVSVRQENETRSIPLEVSDRADVIRQGLRVLYFVKANLKEISRPEAEFLALDHVRLDLDAPGGVWLPRAYDCGHRYDFEFAVFVSDDERTLRLCGAGRCSASGSDADRTPLREAASAAFAAA